MGSVAPISGEDQLRLFEGLEIRKSHLGIRGVSKLAAPEGFEPDPEDLVEVRLKCRVVRKAGDFKAGEDEQGLVADLKWTLAATEEFSVKVIEG